MAKKLKIHTTPKAKSEKDIVDMQIEALRTSRENVVDGIVIGLVKDENFEFYSYWTEECEMEDIYELIENIKNDVMDKDFDIYGE